MTEHLTPHERAAMRGSFIYRDKGDRVTATLLHASQTSAKARKLARELRRIQYMREPLNAEEPAWFIPTPDDPTRGKLSHEPGKGEPIIRAAKGWSVISVSTPT